MDSAACWEILVCFSSLYHKHIFQPFKVLHEPEACEEIVEKDMMMFPFEVGSEVFDYPCCQAFFDVTSFLATVHFKSTKVAIHHIS